MSCQNCDGEGFLNAMPEWRGAKWVEVTYSCPICEGTGVEPERDEDSLSTSLPE